MRLVSSCPGLICLFGLKAAPQKHNKTPRMEDYLALSEIMPPIFERSLAAVYSCATFLLSSRPPPHCRLSGPEAELFVPNGFILVLYLIILVVCQPGGFKYASYKVCHRFEYHDNAPDIWKAVCSILRKAYADRDFQHRIILAFGSKALKTKVDEGRKSSECRRVISLSYCCRDFRDQAKNTQALVQF